MLGHRAMFGHVQKRSLPALHGTNFETHALGDNHQGCKHVFELSGHETDQFASLQCAEAPPTRLCLASRWLDPWKPAQCRRNMGGAAHFHRHRGHWAGDLEFDFGGYGLALMAAACQSLYLVLARNAQDQGHLSSMDLVFYTAFYNSVLFVPLTMMELSEVMIFLQKPGEVPHFFQFLMPYVILGAVLNYATFWCTAVNNPLSTAVAGTLKGVLIRGWHDDVWGETHTAWMVRLDHQHGGWLRIFHCPFQEAQENMKKFEDTSEMHAKIAKCLANI